MPDYTPIEPTTIVVTASRIETEQRNTTASLSIIDGQTIERLGAPLIADLLRLTPSVAVTGYGSAGSLSEVRIRGAEANHTLLFIDGMRANDPAAGNTPRFELVNADLASRIEVVRGPQSALWGSEAVGGVVAVTGPSPGTGGVQAMVEGGSFGTRRGMARGSIGDVANGLSVGIAAQRARGIDSFDGNGDRDGYRNLSLRAAGRITPAKGVRLGASGFTLDGRSEIDGYDPLTYLHADTLDSSRNRLRAGRIFGEVGDDDGTHARLSGSLLGSTNHNYLDQIFLNATRANRRTVALEAGHRVGQHHLFGAVESERERFTAWDDQYGGLTNQERSRQHQSLTAEYRGDFKPVAVDLSVRRDLFSRFADATSWRGSLLAGLGSGFQLAATYGEGIAQPTFFDLYGFFPNSFVGNPALRPERSRGAELALRYRSDKLDATLTGYKQWLRDEIVDQFDPTTFFSTTANAIGTSHRKGIEAEVGYRPSDALRLSAAYAWLNANEPSVAFGLLKEQRRPAHSGHVALDGTSGRFSYGVAAAYSGAKIDTDFDVYPAERVRLDPYWLASARLAYRLTKQVEAHVRLANAFDADYRDVVGYRTEGRSIHAGLRLALGD